MADTLCYWQREIRQMQAILGTGAIARPHACSDVQYLGVNFSVARRIRVVLSFQYMREIRLFILGHLSLLAIAILGSL
jgi:hypothetical protein